jgi:hypothetical protein
MASAWPELPPQGIWEAEEALMRSYEQELRLPYGIIELADLPQSDRDGITNRAWRPTFRLYYVGETDGDFVTLRGKLKALADALEAPLSTGQIVPANVDLSYGRSMSPNDLLIMLNATQRAGMVSGTVAVGLQR